MIEQNPRLDKKKIRKKKKKCCIKSKKKITKKNPFYLKAKQILMIFLVHFAFN